MHHIIIDNNKSIAPKAKIDIMSLVSLFMVILLDTAGVVLVLPVLTPLILQPDSAILPATTPLFLRDILYGFSMALFPLFMFFATPILGDLSDRFGRKKILLVCMLVSAFGYLLSAVSIMVNSLFILLISRALTGMAAGTQPIATAAIIDMSTAENKTRNLAWAVFTSSIGLILGPLIGGVTTQKNLVGWFGFEIPFIAAAAVCFLNAVLLQLSFKDYVINQVAHKINLLKGFTLFLTAFTEKKFRLLSLLYLCFALAWCLYYQTINWFFIEKFNYSAGKLGLFVGFIGVIFALTSSLCSRYLLRLFSKETTAFMFFISLMGLANIGSGISQSELSQWLWVILIAGCNVMCFTVGLSIFSNLAGSDSQGWIMGVTGSLGALTWGVGSFIAGPLGYLHIQLPIWTAGLLCITSFVLMIFYRKLHWLPSASQPYINADLA